MTSPLDRLRGAIEAWRSEEARERVWRWRGSRDASSPAEVIGRHAWLASRSARDALDEAASLGILTAAERAALAAHLAQAAAERDLGDARLRARRLVGERIRLDQGGVPAADAVRELLETPDPRRRADIARAIESLSSSHAPALLDARARADEAASVYEVTGEGAPRGRGASAEGGSGDPASDQDVRALARELLDRTAPLAEEMVSVALRDARSPREATWADLLAGLRAPGVDPWLGARGRWRRIASGLRALGIEEELAARVHVEAHHGTLSPRARVAAIAVPGEIRIAASPLELGLWSELAASDAFGRALALALTSPGLPVEARRPTEQTVGRAYGSLLSQLLADRVFLRRARSLDGSDAERVSRAAARLLLAEARLDAVAVLAGKGTPAERVETASEGLRASLLVIVPSPIAAMVAVAPGGAAARLRGRIAGLAAAAGLRERFDEDWFRNPRADEPLRAGAARGEWISAERWCEDALRVSASDGIRRLIEICG